jgi:hypothetical protein
VSIIFLGLLAVLALLAALAIVSIVLLVRWFVRRSAFVRRATRASTYPAHA